MHKKFCPIIKGNCMGDKCQLWIADGTKVINTKTHKTGIKDTSNCAFEKMGEQAVIKIWEDTERLINEGENTHDQQVSQAAVKEFAEKEKLIWYILDEIACKHSATHVGSGKTPCPICDRVEEAMRLGLYKPTPEECTKLYNSRRKV